MEESYEVVKEKLEFSEKVNIGLREHLKHLQELHQEVLKRNFDLIRENLNLSNKIAELEKNERK